MRCPKCTERNSVAARKCNSCGEKFKRKPIPLAAKLAAGGVLVAVSASLVASLVVPKLIDPEQNLARVAKRFAAGPTSVQDAKAAKKEFTDALRAYLKDVGGAKSNDISANLQKLLESTAFEVHIADLPRGIKLVEVDTLLQATDFLVMKTNSGVKVFDLPSFEVFDDAHILNDSAGPVLALLGHSGGQPPHHPELRAYALLPDYISDETDKLVPPISGDGTARFDKDGQTVRFELALPSMAKTDNIDLQSGKSDVVRSTYEWKDAHYIANSDYGGSSAAVAYMVARAAHHPETIDSRFIGASVAKYAKENTIPANETIVAAKLSASKKQGISYVLTGGGKGFVVSFKKNGNELAAVEVRDASKDEIAKALPQETKVVPAAVAAATTAATNAVPEAATSTPTTTTGAPVIPAAVTGIAKAPRSVATQLASLSPAAGGSKQSLVKAAESKIVVRGLHGEEHGQGAAIAAAAPIAPPVVPKAVAPVVPTKTPPVVQKAQPIAKPDPVAVNPQSQPERRRARAIGSGFVSGKNGATLRTDATVGARAITPLAKGASFEIIGEANGWYKVRYGSHEGYVNSELCGTGRGGNRRVETPVAQSQSTHRADTTTTAHHESRRHHRDITTTAATESHASSPSQVATSTATEHRSRRKRHHDSGNTEVATAPKHRSKAPVVEQPLLVP